jgi:hypothetical protein
MKNTEFNILVVGDLHGEWGHLNTLINKKKPDFIFQCGDFGWWPHFHGKNSVEYQGKKYKVMPHKMIFNQFGIKNRQNGKITKIFWTPGNHENWDDLLCITDYESLKIQDGITYCPFGTVIELTDGRNVLFAGGAKSTDAHLRIEGFDHWRQEEISQEDMDNLPDTNIDIVISHTIPRCFMKKFNTVFPWREDSNARYNDPSTFALQLIYEQYRPSQWFSGHFHFHTVQRYENCIWTALGQSGDNKEKWYVELN